MTDPAAVPLLVPAGNPGPFTGRGNNTWLLDGGEPTLIDAGVGEDSHVEGVAQALGGRPLVRLLVTHGHSDHVSGRGVLQARWPSLECWKWPTMEGDDSGWRSLGSGQVVRAGNRRLQVIHTPGHSADHVCFWDEPAGAAYSGDLLIQGTSVLIPAGRGGSLRAYLASLDRLEALGPAVLYPGHGDVVDRPLALVAESRRHRHTREREILACLPETGSDPDAILARLYPGLAEPLVRAARMTIEAHLEKLREDGILPPGSSARP